MGSITRARTVALVVAVLVAAIVGIVAPSGAGAQAEPTMTITPSSGIREGDEVEVSATGLPQEILGIFQCPADVLDDLASAPFFSRCGFLHIEAGLVGDPYVHTVTPNEVVSYAAAEQTGHCGRAPDACAIVIWAPGSDVRVGAAFSMEPSPLALAGNGQEAGYPVLALVTVPPGTQAQLAQCALPVGATAADSACGPLQPVALDAAGRADVQFELVEEVPGPDGPVTCVVSGCAVAAFDGTGATLDSAPVYVQAPDTPAVSFPDRAFDLSDGTLLRVEVSGIRNEDAVVAQCHASVAESGDVAGGPCGPAQSFEGSPNTTGWFPDLRVYTTFQGTDGGTYRCDEVPGDCVVAIATSEGHFAAAPIGFRRPDVVALSPSTGLLEGDEIAVEGSSLEPGAAYHVLRCADAEPVPEFGPFFDDTCEVGVEESPSVVASPTGTVSTTVAASQRFTTVAGQRVYCRDQCQVALVHNQYWHYGASVATYGMADGALAASPSTGLADGQSVDVTGTDLMPNYAGPLWWVLPTGAWALGQCGSGLLDEPTVAGVFRYCSIPPGGGAVDVPDSTLGRTVEAQASVDPPVGDPIDCGASAGACVVALARVEQDGSVSLHTAPLTFGPL